MISVEEAEQLILNSTPSFEKESIDITSSLGRTLATDVCATRNQPPFHRVAMDGIGINSTTKNISYTIEGVQAAGSEQLTLSDKNNCIEVMTGAPLPVGCDCVIPYEKVKINQQSKVATIDPSDISDMKNVHIEASDYKIKDLLLTKGTLITSPVLAVLASQGESKIDVLRLPKIAVISTGTELVELDRSILPHQIYTSNSYAIKSELEGFGVKEIERIHINDDKSTTEDLIEKTLDQYDAIILTGGVSKGKFDYVPEVLEKLGVNKLFHKIMQKPGKPMWYGVKNQKQVFALPGNPVSCLTCLRRYVIPSLSKSLSMPNNPIYGVLQERVSFKRDFTLFKPVKLNYNKKGLLLLNPITSNGSGDFNSLAHSDGFIELPANKELFEEGEVFRFFPWKK